MATPPATASTVNAVRSRFGAIRRLLRRIRDRSLHPHRRRRALALLRRRPLPRRVLSLCLGNVCRSPYVEASLRAAVVRAGLVMEVSSAGFIGPGRPPPPEALEAAARQGVDTGGHVSRLVSELSGPSADLILLVDSAHTARLRRAAPRLTAPTLVLGDLDPLPVDSRTIPDPWGQPPELFDSVFQRLDRCLAVLVQEWRARGQR